MEKEATTALTKALRIEAISKKLKTARRKKSDISDFISDIKYHYRFREEARIKTVKTLTWGIFTAFTTFDMLASESAIGIIGFGGTSLISAFFTNRSAASTYSYIDDYLRKHTKFTKIFRN